LHSYDVKHLIDRTLRIFCDSTEAVIKLSDFDNRSFPFEIKKKTFKKIFSDCENNTGVIIYSDSLEMDGVYVIFLKIQKY